MIIFISTLLGLLVGSFLNVVIYRLPKMLEAQWQNIKSPLTLSHPRSHCPACEQPVLWWQNIPLLSYVLLSGKCGHCHGKISLRYPTIEVLTAMLCGYLAWHFGYGWPLLASLLFTWILVACFFIDIDHQLLPDNLTLPLLWLGLLFNLNHTFASLNDAVIGTIAGYLFFWVIYWLFKLITKKEGLGYGDFKLLAAIGAWIGWQYLPVVVLFSAVLTLIIAVILRCFKNRDLQKAMAYGPALVIAAWVALLWGHPILNAYLNWALNR
jgi:leader peptidase (prepilin peptidase)/N-methyltransferase